MEPSGELRHLPPSRAAVFVLPSAWGGFGNALAEALACGSPAVSTDCPSGPAEILDHGRYGPLVPLGDDAALAVAIGRVLEIGERSDASEGRLGRVEGRLGRTEDELVVLNGIVLRLEGRGVETTTQDDPRPA